MTQAAGPRGPWRFALGDENYATFHKTTDGERTPRQVTIWSRVVSITPADGWWHVEKTSDDPDPSGTVLDTFVAIPVVAWAVVERADSDGDCWQEVGALVAYAGDYKLSLVTGNEQFIRGTDPEEAWLDATRDRRAWQQTRPAWPGEAAKVAHAAS